MNTAALSIQSELAPMSDLEAMFAEVVLFWEGFQTPKAKNLRYFPEDVAIIQQKREDARAERDYKTADFLRDVLLGAGIRIADKPK